MEAGHSIEVCLEIGKIINRNGTLLFLKQTRVGQNSITGPQAITMIFYVGLCFPSSYSWNKGRLGESSDGWRWQQWENSHSFLQLLLRDFDYWPLKIGYHLMKVQLYLHRTLSGIRQTSWLFTIMGRVRNLSWVHWKQLFDALIQPLSKTWDTFLGIHNNFLGIHNADLSAPKRFVHKPSLGKLIEQ